MIGNGIGNFLKLIPKLRIGTVRGNRVERIGIGNFINSELVTDLSGMFRRSASLAIPHRKSFAAIPSLSLGSLDTRIAASNCHTNRSVRLPSFRHFQANSLLQTRRSGGRKTRLCFAGFVFLMFRGPLASHDSNPYPNRSRIARYNATKLQIGIGLVAPCGWEFNRGRGRGWESRPLSSFCFVLVFKGFQIQLHHYCAVEPLKQFRTRRLRTPSCVWMRDGAR